MAGESYLFWLGASADADRVLSPSATEPEVSAHSGNAPLRDDLLAAAHFVSTDGASLSDEEVKRIASSLRRLAVRPK